MREGWEPTDRREVPEGPERSGVAHSPTPGATSGSGGGHARKSHIMGVVPTTSSGGCKFAFTHRYWWNKLQPLELMVFSSTRLGQSAQILFAGVLGEVGINTFTLPTAGEIETFVHVVVQVVVGLVTIYATVRKMFQRPETVIKLPVNASVLLPTDPPATISAPVAGPVDGTR